ncbi:hypothetical protein AB0M47_22225 [Hamadaea sp. NPDC051192]|uniref:hypothetical protein n=1 Tax=Hamadaea sp. NPDC051192 TaxID=3154940 RepID=UPI0034145B9A
MIDERGQRITELLTDNVHAEMAAFRALHELEMDDRTIETLAEAVAANVMYAFAVDWSPSWLPPGVPHSWLWDGHWFARCPACLRDSAPAASQEAAVTWAETHAAEHHA